MSGLLYEYGDIEQLASKLLSILQDDAYRKKLEQGALKWAARFNWDDAAEEFEKLLIEVVEDDR